MTYRRITTAALTVLAVASLLALPTGAGATSSDPIPNEAQTTVTRALMRKGTQVGAVKATLTKGPSGVAVGGVVARFTGPRAGMTWKARVVASYDCYNDAVTVGSEPDFTHVNEATAWTYTKVLGTKSVLRARGFSHRCSATTTLSVTKIRVLVSLPSGLAYAAATIYPPPAPRAVPA
ncbi:MAG: hypothetical protein JWN41_198 [Thermoleophilia bacterium]|nr:hypothetical protein [Thermoleophilia bacterium]